MQTGLTYRGAAELLGVRPSRKLANNTYLERRDENTIAIRLHGTDVVTLTPEWIELNSGGWHTKTTWDRMSYSPVRVAGGKTGIILLLAGESWETGGHPYFEGIRTNADGTRLLETQPHAPEGIPEKIVTRSGWNGMTPQQSHAARTRMFEALNARDYGTFTRERDTLSGTTQLLQPVNEIDGSKLYRMSQSMISACPHVIFVPEHYRADGTCRCNDPSHREMAEWGYTWNGSNWNGEES